MILLHIILCTTQSLYIYNKFCEHEQFCRLEVHHYQLYDQDISYQYVHNYIKMLRAIGRTFQ